MTIDRVKLSEEVNINGRHFWIGFEAALNENDNPTDCAQELVSEIKKFEDSFDIRYNSMRGTQTKIIQTESPYEQAAHQISLIEEMEKSKGSAAVFKAVYAPQVKTKEEQKVYDRKLKELS